MNKGQKVKLYGVVVRGTDKNGHVHIRIKGTEAEKAVSVETENIRKRRFWG